jgi:hypothetical protein
MKTQKQAWDKNKAGEALVLARRNFSLCRRCCHCCRLEGIAPEVEVDVLGLNSLCWSRVCKELLLQLSRPSALLMGWRSVSHEAWPRSLVQTPSATLILRRLIAIQVLTPPSPKYRYGNSKEGPTGLSMLKNILMGAQMWETVDTTRIQHQKRAHFLELNPGKLGTF